jgi:hypothetical protein
VTIPNTAEARVRADERLRMGSELDTLRGRLGRVASFTELILAVSNDHAERQLALKYREILRSPE